MNEQEINLKLANIVTNITRENRYHLKNNQKRLAQRDIQNALFAISNVSCDKGYQKAFADAIADASLKDADDIKQGLRGIIVDEIGTDSEDCVPADADDLAFLDDVPAVAYADPNDVQALPTLSDLVSVYQDIERTLDTATEKN